MPGELTDAEVAVLIAIACEARKRAYAPYSRFCVGAVVVAEDDRVFAGCNTENASYGLSLCAERSAMAAAIAAGARRLRACVIVADGPTPCLPCGACRQWLTEFGDENLEVVSGMVNGALRRARLGQLLPEAFGPESIHLPPDSSRPAAREGE